MAGNLITANPFGQWIKQEFIARKAQPATNDFERGHLEAMLTLYQIIGAAAFDSETRQLVAKLPKVKDSGKQIQMQEWFKAELSAANNRSNLSEFEMGYLHTILGAYFATEPAQPDPKLQSQFEKLAANPAMIDMAERFDMETRTLNSVPPRN